MLLMLKKEKSVLIPKDLPLATFGELLIVLSIKVNLLYNGPEVLSSASDKVKVFANNFS